jgi:hypothetical protein
MLAKVYRIYIHILFFAVIVIGYNPFFGPGYGLDIISSNKGYVRPLFSGIPKQIATVSVGSVLK